MADDDELRHLCKLAAVYSGFLLSPNVDELREPQTDKDWHNTRNCLQIVARAFVELMARQGMKPTFRMPALSETETSNG